MNANREQTRRIMGRRVLDRIVREGGKIAVIKSTESLRRPRPDDLDGAGRSKRWHRAKWLLEVVGCEHVSRAIGHWETQPILDCEEVKVGEREVFVHSDQYEETPQFGDALAGRLPRSGLDEAERVRVRLGLDARAVAELARELAENSTDDPLEVLANAFTSKLRAEASKQQRAKPQSLAEIDAEARALVALRRERLNTMLAKLGRPPVGPSTMSPHTAKSYWDGIAAGPVALPEDPGGIRTALTPLGFRVVGEPGRVRVERVIGKGRAQVVHTYAASLPTHERGWLEARKAAQL
jgi:hypothetical protein